MAYLKVGKGEGTGRRRVLITTGVHGKELAPPEAVLNYLRKLLEAYRDGHPISVAAFTDRISHLTFPAFELSLGSVKSIIEDLDLFVVPLVNPDGRAFELALNPLLKPDGTFNPVPGGSGLQWRMNRRQNPGTNPANPLCTGVDINRNFEIAWKTEQYYTNPTNNVDSFKDPCDSDSYRGPFAASEPETQNIVELVTTQSIQFLLDIHAHAGAIFYPWAIEDTQVDDESKSFRNSAWHTPPGRDGVDHSGYAEFFPDEYPGSLRERHRDLADTMKDEILNAAGTNEETRRVSTYQAGHAAEITHTAQPGNLMDWVFSRQFLPIVGVPKPIFSLTMEVLAPNLVQPNPLFPAHDALIVNGLRPDPETEYPKAEREIFIAVHTFLKFVSGPCFIATAAFGSAHHPHVQLLRDLRDRMFPSTPFGKRFIGAITRIYDAFSPALARYLDSHEAARRFTRVAFLSPLVGALRGAKRIADRTDRPVAVLAGSIVLMVLTLAGAAGALLVFVLKLLLVR